MTKEYQKEWRQKHKEAVAYQTKYTCFEYCRKTLVTTEGDLVPIDWKVLEEFMACPSFIKVVEEHCLMKSGIRRSK